MVIVAAFFTVNIAQESSGAMAAARKSVLERSRNPAQSAAFREAVEAGQAAWEDAVEKHWPAALAWAQAHVEDAFPGANVTELWVTMQHVYARLQDAAVGGAGGGDAGPGRWVVAVKDAGGMVAEGDVSGAFARLKDLGAELLEAGGGGGGGGGGDASRDARRSTSRRGATNDAVRPRRGAVRAAPRRRTTFPGWTVCFVSPARRARISISRGGHPLRRRSRRRDGGFLGGARLHPASLASPAAW